MFELTVEPSEDLVTVADGQTILDACLRAGVWLPHACGHGLCGTCKVEVLDGEIQHGNCSSFALMDFERDEGFTLACSATVTTDVTIEADIDEGPDAESRPVQDFVGTVSRLENLTGDILGIWLSVPDSGAEFQAGQYLNLSVDGVDQPRAFSFANSPSQPGEVELHVRLIPGGEATTVLHEQLSVGDELRFAAPYGRFHVRKSADKPLLFMAGGSGLTSPKSMILDLLENSCTHPITLIHGVRTAADLYFDDLFRDLEGTHDNFRYVPALSEADDDTDWDGETGFVNTVAERLFDGSFKGMSAYLCGPPPMIDACVTTLMKGRLFERDIFMERFVTAADAETEAGRGRSPLFKAI